MVSRIIIPVDHVVCFRSYISSSSFVFFDFSRLLCPVHRDVPCRARIWWLRAVPNILVPCPYDPYRAKHVRAVPGTKILVQTKMESLRGEASQKLSRGRGGLLPARGAGSHRGTARVWGAAANIMATRTKSQDQSDFVGTHSMTWNGYDTA